MNALDFEMQQNILMQGCKKEEDMIIKRNSSLVAIVVSLFIALLMASCASSKKVQSTTPLQEIKAPGWVLKSGDAFKGEKGRAFYGVGVAAGGQNVTIIREKADSRARADIVKVLNVYTSSLLKDYNAQTGVAENNSFIEKTFERAIKEVAAMTLSGVQIVDRWQHPSTGDLYSLAMIELELFKSNIEKLNELNSKAREYIRQNADRMHEQLVEEEEKTKYR